VDLVVETWKQRWSHYENPKHFRKLLLLLHPYNKKVKRCQIPSSSQVSLERRSPRTKTSLT
jgi:hypothetical protein